MNMETINIAINSSDNETFYLTRARLTCLYWKEGIVLLQRYVHCRLEKQFPKTLYNRLISFDSFERKFNEIVVGLKGSFDVQPDYAWKTRQMYNGIKVDYTCRWRAPRTRGRVLYKNYLISQFSSTKKVVVCFEKIKTASSYASLGGFQSFLLIK